MEHGDHCSLQGCNQVDFLPFICTHCKRTFCLSHRLCSAHSCASSSVSDPDVSSSTENLILKVSQRCSAQDCDVKEIAFTRCNECHQNHCLVHRHPDHHLCGQAGQRLKEMASITSDVKVANRRLEEAKRRITDKIGTKKVSSKNAALQRKVQLMKLKLKAVGPDTVPEQRRFYIQAHTENNIVGVFFDEDWTVAKALDNICKVSKTPNHNDDPREPQLTLFVRLEDGDCQPLPFFESLKNCSLIQSGDTVFLERVERDSNTSTSSSSLS